jgi:hypothetical protein
MAVTITDRRSIVDEADTTTGWTGAGFGTTTSDIAEGGAAVAASLAATTGQVYYTNTTPVDLSNTLVYVWVFNNALQNTWTDGPTSLLIGDGTNQIAFHQGGSDRRIFAHSDGPVSWQSAVIDGSIANTLTEVTAIAGSLASLNLASIADFGGHFITNSKALGGGYNVAVDIIRIGNDGLRVTGGNTTDRGTFLEIAQADRSTANQAGHGAFRETSPISFGVQSPLTFGDLNNATESQFSDSGVTVVYEDRDIADNKYYLNIEGNTSTTNYFNLVSSTVASAGPGVSIQANSGGINTLNIDGVTFSQLLNPITFSNLADATGHTISGCSFNSCGKIDPGNTTFQDNSMTGSTDTTGAILLDADGSAKWTNLNFTMNTINGGHAIEITAAGTYTFTGFTYTGYGANGTANSVILNNSNAAVTINLTGGDTPTVNNLGTGATTTLVSSATMNVTNMHTESEIRIVDTTNNVIVDGVESVNGAVVSVSIADGGSSYTVSDTLTVVGGTGTAATLTVTSVNGGVIDGISIATAGNYTVDPVNPVSVTGGTGSGATFNLDIRGSFAYAYGGSPIYDIVVFHIDYKDIRFVDFNFPSSNSSLLISQIVDRVYSNP